MRALRFVSMICLSSILSSACITESKFRERTRELACDMEQACLGPEVELICDRSTGPANNTGSCWKFDGGEAARCIERLEELVARAEEGDADACIEYLAYTCGAISHKTTASCTSDV